MSCPLALRRRAKRPHSTAATIARCRCSRATRRSVCCPRAGRACLCSTRQAGRTSLQLELPTNSLCLYNCTEWAPPLADDAPAPGAPAQGHDDDSARPLSLPPLDLLSSLCVRQDEDNGEVAAAPSLPPQRQVTKHIMQTWTLHEQMLRNPDRMRNVHMLHHTQSVPMLDETSALHGNMPQRNDEEGGKQPRLSFSPAASVWGQMGRAWTTGGRNAARTT